MDWGIVTLLVITKKQNKPRSFVSLTVCNDSFLCFVIRSHARPMDRWKKPELMNSKPSLHQAWIQSNIMSWHSCMVFKCQRICSTSGTSARSSFQRTPVVNTVKNYFVLSILLLYYLFFYSIMIYVITYCFLNHTVCLKDLFMHQCSPSYIFQFYQIHFTFLHLISCP